MILHRSNLLPWCVALTVLFAQLAILHPASASEPDGFRQIVTPAIKEHCLGCHGAGDELHGDVNLLEMDQDKLAGQLDLVHAMIDALDRQEMPPAEQPPLPEALRQQLIAELKSMLHSAVKQNQTFAATPLRRMNRFQYNNAVVDLFQLRCTVFTLPERMVREHKGYFKPQAGKMPDVVSVGSRPLGKSQLIENRLDGVAAFPQDLRAEHGFDNQGDHLSLSPLLMESFLKLGYSITDSPDFVARNVGIWDSFFASPAVTVDRDHEVRQRLQHFLTDAFRGPAPEDVLERYVQHVIKRLESGVEFPDAMKSVAAAAIASPRFLYLYDRANQSQSAEPVDAMELASRMSFFLWGSIPDARLLELATTEALSEPETLESEITRMLTDPKLKRFCDSFPAQWLQLERIISSVPSTEKYPDFYFAKYRASMHMMIEPLLLFETVLIENLPITQLIDSDFTYRSNLLDRAYGDLRSAQSQPGKGGDEVAVLTFHRVPVADRRSGGVITNAAVMTMTSGPERTQPITRGAWIATVIFNDPPEPPPADVPPLGEKPAHGEEHLTLRERLALHRERSDCRGCHEQIDPLGFALENYDPVGRWRERYGNGREIDPAGNLFRTQNFTDVVQFKTALLAEKDRFTRALGGHLLAFALARPLDASDQIALDKIASATAEDDYKLQTLIKQVILSEPFRSKSNPQEP